jgi:hypothetical protein
MLGALSSLGERESGLVDARCPKCNAADFAKVSDLFYDTVRRAEASGLRDDVPAGQGGMTDEQIIVKFKPPRRQSPLRRTIIAAIPIAVAAFLVYRRFGELGGEVALVASLVILITVFMTTARRLSDAYYDRKQRWNKLYMCRKCGQVVMG